MRFEYTFGSVSGIFINRREKNPASSGQYQRHGSELGPVLNKGYAYIGLEYWAIQQGGDQRVEGTYLSQAFKSKFVSAIIIKNICSNVNGENSSLAIRFTLLAKIES